MEQEWKRRRRSKEEAKEAADGDKTFCTLIKEGIGLPKVERKCPKCSQKYQSLTDEFHKTSSFITQSLCLYVAYPVFVALSWFSFLTFRLLRFSLQT